MRKYATLSIVLFLLLVSASAITAQDNYVSISQTGVNSASISGYADGQVNLDCGNGATWQSGDPAGSFSESCSYDYDPVSGGTDYTISVSGAISASQTINVCWTDCESESESGDAESIGNGEGDSHGLGNLSPETTCNLPNPGDAFPVPADDLSVFWQVKWSDKHPVYVAEENGGTYLSYNFNAHNHKDQVWDQLPASLRPVVDQDGNDTGWAVGVVNHRADNPWWRCTLVAPDGTVYGRPQLTPEEVAADVIGASERQFFWDNR